MKRALPLALAALMVAASGAPAWAGRAKRKSRRAQTAPPASQLGEPTFTSYIEITGSPEPDLRDAPAPVSPAPAPAPAAA
ncbi:MAG: hypothetical protein HY553_07910, partial [Elusimicrobia bacterium]|nr:hypothetical protein [Elusimicrobiota bacterium]